MKATYMYGAGDVRIENVPDPVIQQPTDAIVRAVRSCVCGSDLHPYHSMPHSEAGRPMGHEMIGVVEETGIRRLDAEEGRLRDRPLRVPGQHVRVLPRGVPDLLHPRRLVRQHRGRGTAGRTARIPQADGSLVVVPGIDETSELLPSLLTLSDVYLTGFHAAHMGKVSAGKTVTVIGDGAVGLSAVLASRQLGAERIILMGRHGSRTDLGIEFGATDVVAERGEEGIAKVMELTRGEGSHVVLEAVGHMPAYEQAYGVVRPGGVISRVGVPQYEEAPVGFGSLFGKNATLTGGPAPVRAYMEPAIRQVLNGEINPGRVFDRSVGSTACRPATRP